MQTVSCFHVHSAYDRTLVFACTHTTTYKQSVCTTLLLLCSVIHFTYVVITKMHIRLLTITVTLNVNWYNNNNDNRLIVLLTSKPI